MPESPPPSDLLSSVARALRVLSTVGDSPRGLTAKQIARRCGLIPATAYHLVRTLTYEGYLVRREDGTYILGLQIAHRYQDLRRTIRPPTAVTEELRTLAAHTGYTHCIAQFIDERVTLTTVALGPRSPHHEDLIPGSHHAPHTTAWGLALLATLPATQQALLLARGDADALTVASVVDGRATVQPPNTQRSALYSETGHYDAQTASAAVVVSTPSSGQPAALACVLPAADLPRFEQQVHRRLQAATARIAGMLPASAASRRPSAAES